MIQLLKGLPHSFPLPVIVVQHMMPEFTRSLAQRFNDHVPLSVSEAVPGKLLEPGHVLVAPGGRHLSVSSRWRVRILSDPPRHGVRPSVDVTLETAAPIFGERMLAVILTGMGRDGALGCQQVKAHGGTVWVQDEASSVVFGMPKAVIELQAADRVLPLDTIAHQMDRWASRLILRSADARGVGDDDWST